MNDIHEAVRDIMEGIPTEQLKIDAQAHLRTKIFTIIFRYNAITKEGLLKKISDLDRQLYIAKKKAEDYRIADEYNSVDKAGFNK
jgi:hypothetical protein